VPGPVLRASTPDQEAWVARRGRVVEKLQETQRNVLYQDLVNTVRAEISIASSPFKPRRPTLPQRQTAKR
jgi:hypothetical protein